ncbi:MAG: VOC family protein [Terriglobia bacterium]|jgi:catechol 2,3-dioxygenase-like lactoylglutathione lyase family enzyme
MTQSDSPQAVAIRFEGGNPIFRVRSVAASIDYYVRVLGFKLDWENPRIFASVTRGRFNLFLAEGDQGNPGSWVWIGVSDADALLAEYRASGAKIRHSPTNYAWTYEMQVEDLDGNVLRMGSEPKPDQPIGEWLDMRGVAWVPIPEGGWKRQGHEE